MANINDTLSRPGSDWQAFEPPLSAEEILDACRVLDCVLPPSLIELYRACNGGEGSLPFQPWNFVLWGIDYVVELNEDEHYRTCYSDFLFFGSNGGGEYFGLDLLGRVFFMDPIAGKDSIITVSQSFDEFVGQIGILPPRGIPTIDGK